MIQQLQRSSSWTGRVAVLAFAVIAMSVGHAGGVETRAWGQNAGVALAGSVFGLAMLSIVLARLFGKNIGLIRSDLGAVGALLVMVGVKVALARLFL